MKYSLSTLFSCAVCFNLVACIDPPTPVGLTESTFENEKLLVSSGNIELGSFLIYFDEKEGKWCHKKSTSEVLSFLSDKTMFDKNTGEIIKGPESAQTKNCGGRTLVLQDKKSGKTVGVALLDSKAKTVTLYQVKTPTFGQNFEIDKTAAHLIFSDNSSGDFQRIKAKAVGPDGILGSVVAERNIYAKGFAGAPREKIDLRNPQMKIAGCSEATSPLESEPRVKPKSRFVYGADLHQ